MSHENSTMKNYIHEKIHEQLLDKERQRRIEAEEAYKLLLDACEYHSKRRKDAEYALKFYAQLTEPDFINVQAVDHFAKYEGAEND